jgi:8-oxo-dGTP pyrophosphatase MutT (NUDIX family)
MSGPADGEWIHRGETEIYASDWVGLYIADVVMPDGTQVDHHVVRVPRPAAGMIMKAGEQVLLLYRHRFITDTWGWEIPAGGVDPGESNEAAATREALEESGWEPTTVRHLCHFNPANGILDQPFHIYVSDDAQYRGEPSDPNEATRVEWVPFAEVRQLLTTGQILDGLTFAAISYAIATGVID